MRPIVISATIQEFDGVRYYLCGRYFQRKGVRLHIRVWEHHNGPVPEGHHIHHADDDRSNNDPGNLECLTIPEHLGGRHGEESGRRGRGSIKKANVAAAAWHGSPKGKQWHSEHFEQHIKPTMDKRVPAVCRECGGKYLVSAARIAQGKFCSGACKARALRKRRRGGKG